jgi:predicted ATP-grasp superfamily ATP-dependent carboligase
LLLLIFMAIEKLTVLLIDEGASVITLRVMRCLEFTNQYRIHVISFNGRQVPSVKYSRHVSSFKSFICKYDEQAFIHIKEEILSIRPDIVLPLMERQTAIVAKYRDEFQKICRLPPLPDSETLQLVINKLQLYNWLFEKGFSDSLAFSISFPCKSAQSFDNIRFPLLLKPCWGSSGEGIIFIHDKAHLESILSHDISGNFLLQPYFPGSDIDLSALVDEGRILAYTIQNGLNGSKVFKYSKGIVFSHNNDLLTFASKIFESLHYSGIAHLDFRYDSNYNKFYLVDFNARYWSTLTGSLMAGVNFPHLACLKAVNSEIPKQEFNNIQFLSSESPVYILLKSIGFPFSHLSMLIKNELSFGSTDPIPWFFNGFNQIRAKFKWIVHRMSH